MSPLLFILMQFLIIAYALISGVFLAFSDFIMRALARTPDIGGIRAMQVINREVFGCFGGTVCFNVPMNEALANMDPTADATFDYWTGSYLPRWTFWNTIRTIASGLSAALLLVGLVSIIQTQTPPV